VLRCVDKGNSASAASRKFGVSTPTVCKWIKLKDETRDVIPKERKKFRKGKIDKERLIQTIKSQPDIFLYELAEIFNCSEYAVSNCVSKLCIVRDKKILWKLILKDRRVSFLAKQQKEKNF